MVSMYRRGRIIEKKICNDLVDMGFCNIRRSAGSRGPSDIYAFKDGNKYYIQAKGNSADVGPAGIDRLRNHARQRHGAAVVINRMDGKNKWRFFGNWND